MWIIAGGADAAIGDAELGFELEARQVARAVIDPDVVVLVDAESDDAADLPLVRQRLRPVRVEHIARCVGSCAPTPTNSPTVPSAMARTTTLFFFMHALHQRRARHDTTTPRVRSIHCAGRRHEPGTPVAMTGRMLKLIGSYVIARFLGFGLLGALVIYVLLSILS